MRTSTLLYAIAGISSGLATIQFGDRILAECSESCYKDIIGRPGLKECGKDDELCYCQEYAIMDAMQDCLSKTNSCGEGRDRVDTIYDLQEVCDEVILAAAQPSSTSPSDSSPTDNGDDPVASNASNTEAEPTSLEEAEGRLGASASALINEKPFQLSTGQKAGIAVGSIAAFMVLGFIAFCCGVYHYKSHVIKKMNREIQNSPAVGYPTFADDKGTGSSWFSKASRGSTNSHELGYGLDKELGLMISAPSNPRKYTTTKIRTVDIPQSEHTIPRAPPPAVSPHRNPSGPGPHSSPKRTMSLGSVTAAQRPSLTLTSPKLVLPQATIEEYTPRNSIRVSVQSLHQKPPQNGPNINIPLMFFTPATPQMNASPISPSDSSANEIYNYYSRDSVGAEANNNGIGIARTSIDERTTPSPQPYDPTDNDYTRTPSPGYTVSSQASPYINHSTTPEPRHGTPGFDLSSDTSSRISSPSPVGAGLHMPPRHTPYTPRQTQSPNPSPSPAPSESSQGPPVPPKVMPEMVDLSAIPATISRANSHAWRLSVERAADRAMDKIRTTPTSEIEDVPEEEERLTKSELPNTSEDVRGRRKRRPSQDNFGASVSKSSSSRSGSIGNSRSPSGRRTSAGGYARRSSSIGGYRKRTNSLGYNQIDGVPMPAVRKNSRRGSNSSSVMMI
ncbi:hypothetical protein ABW19_dt0206903 [Dactylella cylindrospora]|nr:hypothetical protein ABW19_dt0206903 [Dactylella cylindrospora]